MRPVVSDLNRSATPAPRSTSTGSAMGAVPTSGTFTSRVLVADSAHTVWGNLTEHAAAARRSRRAPATPRRPTPAGRDFQAVGAGGAIQSPSGQYIQYRATLSGASRQPRQRLARLHGRQRGAERGDRLGRRERQHARASRSRAPTATSRASSAASTAAPSPPARARRRSPASRPARTRWSCGRSTRPATSARPCRGRSASPARSPGAAAAPDRWQQPAQRRQDRAEGDPRRQVAQGVQEGRGQLHRRAARRPRRPARSP